MVDPIVTAGAFMDSAPASNPRKDAIKAVRTILRDTSATDNDVDDALEALLELSKD